MPKIDLDSIEQVNRTGYPSPFNQEVAGRWYRRLAPAAGLTDFGVSHVVLKPGAWSSQRHWHNGEDEFLVMVSGEAVLVEDDGRTVLKPGDYRFQCKHIDGKTFLVVSEVGSGKEILRVPCAEESLSDKTVASELHSVIRPDGTRVLQSVRIKGETIAHRVVD